MQLLRTCKRCSVCHRELRLFQFSYTPDTSVCRTCKRRNEKENEQTGGNTLAEPKKKKSPFNHTDILVEGGPHLDPMAYLEEATEKIREALEEKLSDMM